MRGAALMFIIAIIAFSLMAGCLEQPAKPKPSKPNITENITQNITTENATKEITVGPCKGETRADVDACLMNNSLCADIENAQLKDYCYFKNMNCNKIVNDDLRHNCQISVGFSACTNEANQSLCRALAVNDPYYCGSNTECLLMYAYKTNTSDTCNLVGGTGYEKSACKAIIAYDPYKCYVYEQYEATQKECIKLFSKITGVDGNICSQIKEQLYREDCYSGVAYSSRDYSNCLYITTYKTKKDCILNVAIETANASICEYSSTFTDDIGYCKERVAEYNLMPSICQEINVPGYIWPCFANSILNNKTLKSECYKITNPLYNDWKEECLRRAREG